jgi:hypothetical protein
VAQLWASGTGRQGKAGGTQSSCVVGLEACNAAAARLVMVFRRQASYERLLLSRSCQASEAWTSRSARCGLQLHVHRMSSTTDLGLKRMRRCVAAATSGSVAGRDAAADQPHCSTGAADVRGPQARTAQRQARHQSGSQQAQREWYLQRPAPLPRTFPALLNVPAAYLPFLAVRHAAAVSGTVRPEEHPFQQGRTDQRGSQALCQRGEWGWQEAGGSGRGFSPSPRDRPCTSCLGAAGVHARASLQANVVSLTTTPRQHTVCMAPETPACVMCTFCRIPHPSSCPQPT